MSLRSHQRKKHDKKLVERQRRFHPGTIDAFRRRTYTNRQFGEANKRNVHQLKNGER